MLILLNTTEANKYSPVVNVLPSPGMTPPYYIGFSGVLTRGSVVAQYSNKLTGDEWKSFTTGLDTPSGAYQVTEQAVASAAVARIRAYTSSDFAGNVQVSFEHST